MTINYTAWANKLRTTKSIAKALEQAFTEGVKHGESVWWKDIDCDEEEQALWENATLEDYAKYEESMVDEILSNQNLQVKQIALVSDEKDTE